MVGSLKIEKAVMDSSLGAGVGKPLGCNNGQGGEALCRCLQLDDQCLRLTAAWWQTLDLVFPVVEGKDLFELQFNI